MQEKELEGALYEYLKQNGAVERMKLALTTEVFSALQGEERPTREISVQQSILDELIREYLAFAGYGNTEALFKEEADLSRRGISRDLIEAHLKVEASKKIPLLLALVFPRPDN